MSVEYKDLGIGKTQSTWRRKPRVASKELSERERQVLSMMVSGFPQARISESLGIAQSTLWQHVHNIKSKLRMENLVQVGIWAERNGYRAGQRAPVDQCPCGPNCDGLSCWARVKP